MENYYPKSREEWFALVKEFEGLNVSQKDFCNERKLVLGRFTYYVQVYRKSKLSTNEKVSRFSPVIISQAQTAPVTEIKIELPNGFRCQVACAIEPEVLKRLLGALLSC